MENMNMKKIISDNPPNSQTVYLRLSKPHILKPLYNIVYITQNKHGDNFGGNNNHNTSYFSNSIFHLFYQ